MLDTIVQNFFPMKVFGAVLTPSEAIQTYLRAKDQNRPHLMRRVFSETAKLEMDVETGAISFPPVTIGVDEITRVLVRDFGQVYENVYTFCLANPPASNAGKFACRWMVGMSEKVTGAVRIGCGHYDWSFQPSEPHLVDKLGIAIKTMLVLPPECLRPVMDWLSELPYPWCRPSEAVRGMPNLAAIEDVRKFIDQSPA
jgi:hypothetical protein